MHLINLIFSIQKAYYNRNKVQLFQQQKDSPPPPSPHINLFLQNKCTFSIIKGLIWEESFLFEIHLLKYDFHIIGLWLSRKNTHKIITILSWKTRFYSLNFFFVAPHLHDSTSPKSPTLGLRTAWPKDSTWFRLKLAIGFAFERKVVLLYNAHKKDNPLVNWGMEYGEHLMKQCEAESLFDWQCSWSVNFHWSLFFPTFSFCCCELILRLDRSPVTLS